MAQRTLCGILLSNNVHKSGKHVILGLTGVFQHLSVLHWSDWHRSVTSHTETGKSSMKVNEPHLPNPTISHVSVVPRAGRQWLSSRPCEARQVTGQAVLITTLPNQPSDICSTAQEPSKQNTASVMSTFTIVQL